MCFHFGHGEWRTRKGAGGGGGGHQRKPRSSSSAHSTGTSSMSDGGGAGGNPEGDRAKNESATRARYARLLTAFYQRYEPARLYGGSDPADIPTIVDYFVIERGAAGPL